MCEKLLIENGTVVTLGAQGRVIPDGGVLVKGGTIVAVGPTAELESMVRGESAKGADDPEGALQRIDAGGRLIMPGLICAHHHLYSTLACGLAAKPAKDFVEVLENLWWRLDRALDLDDVYDSALIPLARCIASGTTTILDHHASPNAIAGSLGRIGDAVDEAGIRASLCYEVTDRNGPQGAQAGLDENEAWLERSKGRSRQHGLVGLHAAMTIGKETLDACVKLAQRHDTGIHIHVAESAADQANSIEKHGQRVLERLYDAGGLGKQSMAIHCVHVDERELEILRETDTIVVHNPQSNMNNAVGCAAVPEMLQRGIRVCLGTDGMTSNMLEEARASLFIRHHVARDPSAGFGETLQMLLGHNPSVASAYFGRPIGALEPGAAADVIIVDYQPFTPLTPENAGGHLLFGAAACRVDTTICDGRVLMRDGKILTLDMEAICQRAMARSPKTWERFGAL